MMARVSDRKPEGVLDPSFLFAWETFYLSRRLSLVGLVKVVKQGYNQGTLLLWHLFFLFTFVGISLVYCLCSSEMLQLGCPGFPPRTEGEKNRSGDSPFKRSTNWKSKEMLFFLAKM